MVGAMADADVPTVPADVLRAIRDIPDPEVPVVTIEDLGILRGVSLADGELVVTITPTYSGCPAMETIRDRVVVAAREHGYAARVVTRLTPVWTTDWMSARGKDALARFGIAPPGGRAQGVVSVGLSVRRVTCPLCGSHETEELSHFGATACKALRRCLSCREPFEEFKAI